MGVEISAGRLDVGIEYLQTMELIRFVLCRPISANQLALRELCVTAQVEICVQADWRAVNLPLRRRRKRGRCPLLGQQCGGLPVGPELTGVHCTTLPVHCLTLSSTLSDRCSTLNLRFSARRRLLDPGPAQGRPPPPQGADERVRALRLPNQPLVARRALLFQWAQLGVWSRSETSSLRVCLIEHQRVLS